MHDASLTMLRSMIHIFACPALLCGSFLTATEEDNGIPPLRDLPDFDAMAEDTTPPTAEPTANAETIKLIAEGITLQKKLLTTLHGITNKSTADAAAKEILRLSTELKIWGSKLDARPAEDAEIMEDYERNFLPEIRKWSNEIRKESERINTYNYFGSALLYESLAELVIQAQ